MNQQRLEKIVNSIAHQIALIHFVNKILDFVLIVKMKILGVIYAQKHVIIVKAVAIKKMEHAPKIV